MQKIHVYLDDLRSCPDGFTLARDAEECIFLLQQCEVDILSLDYELGWGQKTGQDVVKFIVESNRYPREIYLHTSSIEGRLKMYETLHRHKPPEVKLYYGSVPLHKIIHSKGEDESHD